MVWRMPKTEKPVKIIITDHHQPVALGALGRTGYSTADPKPPVACSGWRKETNPAHRECSTVRGETEDGFAEATCAQLRAEITPTVITGTPDNFQKGGRTLQDVIEKRPQIFLGIFMGDFVAQLPDFTEVCG